MKKLWFLLIVFFIFSALSCKKNVHDIIIISEDDTLKSTIEAKENSIYWTEAFEEDILKEEIKAPEILDQTILSVALINSVPELVPDVYPCIENIGSLDNTEVSGELITFIKNVCNQIKINPKKNLDAYFNEEYQFNYVFFKTDLEQNWEQIFNSKYPQGQVFQKYYIGKIKEGFDLTEVTCRFYTENNYVDLTLYISQNEKKLNVKQIEIQYERS